MNIWAVSLSANLRRFDIGDIRRMKKARLFEKAELVGSGRRRPRSGDHDDSGSAPDSRGSDSDGG